MSDDIAIRVNKLSKVYKLYDTPGDRFKETFHPFRKKYHRDFYALDNVSFEVRRGETVGIIGKNGSGKSTLLKVLTGVLTPSSGSVEISGRVSALLELGAGFNPEFTGIENVYLSGTIMGYTREEMAARLDDILAFADIGDFVHQPVKMYSSGMYVRLAFAVSINVNPDVLIVDEALAVGDMRFQVKCHRKFQEFREKDISVLFVSHSMTDVLNLCGRAIWLDDGSIRKSGVAKNVTEEYHAWMVHDSGILKPAEMTAVEADDVRQAGALVPVPANACMNGDGGAFVRGVGFFTDDNTRITSLDRGRKVSIVFEVFAKVRIENPFFGFQIINNKSIRVLSNSNIIMGKKLSPIEADSVMRVCFSFYFPEIENGAYFIAIGVNDGTIDNHIRHQYILDAYEFQFQSTDIRQRQSGFIKIYNCNLDVNPVL